MNTQEILSNTNNGLDIFQTVLNRQGSEVTLKTGKNNELKNPFYDDQNGSLSIYQDPKTGKYLYKDFGNTNYQGDAIDFFARHKGLDCKANFPDVVDLLCQEFAIQNSSPRDAVNHLNKPEISKREVHKVVLCESQAGWEYWKELFPYSDSIEAKAVEFGLKSLDYIETDAFQLKGEESNPLFAFELGPDCYKTYKPITKNSTTGVQKSSHRWINKDKFCEERFIDLLIC